MSEEDRVFEGGSLFEAHPVGVVYSSLKTRKAAPLQGTEGAPDATIVVKGELAAALDGVKEGDEIIVLTWLHEANRDRLQIHPRGDSRNALAGVFATRSPDRPNPIGLHRVRVLAVEGCVLSVAPLEAIDGTPVLDIKPVLPGVDET